MRRLIYPALILLPVLAHAQAKAQTSTLTAAPSRASVATLEAKANTPHVLPGVAAAAASAPAGADPGTQIMVPIHQVVVERNEAGADSTLSDSAIGFTFTNDAMAATAPKLIEAAPLSMSLRDMELESEEAAVLLQFTVDLEGMPRDVKVLRSGGTTLDKRAIEAVNMYRFKPATQNHLPVEAAVTVEIKIKKS